jgi:cytochrome c553
MDAAVQRMPSRFAMFSLVVVSLGCQASPPQASPKPTLAASIRAIEVRMHVRFESARRIEDAVARSDLDRVRQEARVLSSLAEPEALPRWQPYLAQIQASGRRLEQVTDVAAAADASAVLGRECARCHEAIEAKVSFPDQPRPEADARLAPQMLGHQWAAAQMWEGLIGPAGDRWLAGAQALTQVPLTIVAEQPRGGDLADTIGGTGETIGDDVARVRRYATHALAATSQDARAAIFGQLLATCAHCHAMIRDR